VKNVQKFFGTWRIWPQDIENQEFNGDGSINRGSNKAMEWQKRSLSQSRLPPRFIAMIAASDAQLSCRLDSPRGKGSLAA
jgi:hypothetical protein